MAKDIWGVLVEKLLNGYSLNIESILKIMRREEFGFLVDYKLLMVMWCRDQISVYICKSRVSGKHHNL